MRDICTRSFCGGLFDGKRRIACRPVRVLSRKKRLSRIAQIIQYISKSPDHDVFGELTEIWIADAKKSDGTDVRWSA
jgi:hypothetical protein